MYFLRPMHGFENPGNIRDCLKNINVHEETVFENCCRIYNDTKLGTIQLYPYAMETLELLKEYHRLFIVTDANHANAVARLEKLELIDFFDHIITSDMTKTANLDMKVFYHAWSRAGFHAEEVLFGGG